MADTEDNARNIPPEQFLEISKGMERLKAIHARLSESCPNIDARAIDCLAISISLLEQQLESDDVWPTQEEIEKELGKEKADQEIAPDDKFNPIKDGPCQNLPLKFLKENSDKTMPSADELNNWFEMKEDDTWPAE